MQKIPFLLKKLQELQDLPLRKTRIDIDLMLDYSRKLYGELLALREEAPGEQAGGEPAPGNDSPIDPIVREPGKPVPGDPVSKEPATGDPAPGTPVFPSPTPQSVSTPHSAPASSSAPGSAPAIPAGQERSAEPLHTAGEPAPPAGKVFPPDPEAPPAGNDAGSGTTQPPSGNQPLNGPVQLPYESAQPAPARAVIPPPSPKKDIRKSIGINDKYQIISELFHNDKEAYETAIDEINNSISATEAIDWLHDHVAWNYNWSEDNYTVQLFYGLISQHFKHQTG